MDFIAGRGYAIGDDGTALRTDDGGATWTGLATGTSQDLTRVQAVTPDVVVVLGGDGCVVRRSDDGGTTFRKMFVLAETNCPDRVAAAYFVTPAGRLPAAARRQRAAHDRRRPDVRPRHRDPGHAGERRRRPGRRPPTRSSPPPTPASCSSPARNTAFRTTDAGASWTPEPDVEAGNVQRMRAVERDDVLRLRPGHAAALAPTPARPGSAAPRGAGNTITGIGCATRRPLPADHRPRRPAAAHRERRRHRRADHRLAPPPLYAAGLRQRRPARSRPAPAARPPISDDGGRNYAPVGGDIAGSFQFGLRLGPAPSIALALGARGQLARTTDNGADVEGDQRRHLGRHAATRRSPPPTTATRSTSAAACSAPPTAARAGSRSTPARPSAPRAVITTGDIVLLAGPRGVRRAAGGGEFSLAGGRARSAAVDQFDRARLGDLRLRRRRRSSARPTAAARWTAIKGPSRKRGRRRSRCGCATST